MNKIEKLKTKIKYIKEYKNRKKTIKADIERFNKYVKEKNEKFEQIKKRFSPDSLEYYDAKTDLLKWQYNLQESYMQLKYVRPNIEEDIEYRNKQLNTFVEKIQNILPNDCNLRFHGTPIYFAEEIIKRGNISSTADRYDGYIKSTDLTGEISASDIQTIDRTISYFCDMAAYNRSLPAGCIFSIFPKDEEDANYGKDTMHLINFKQNPQQLYAIITTPENIKLVKKWMNESNLNSDVVYTFEEFLEKAKETEREKKQDNFLNGYKDNPTAKPNEQKNNEENLENQEKNAQKQTDQFER